jgi:4-amino-4-deoxy-L-arabinose transferase-like glycosyltransferase
MSWPQSTRACGLGLAVATFALSALYSTLTPLWESPDEPIHFDFVKHVADRRRLPSLYDEGAILGQTLQPPLYYVLAALPILSIDTSDIGRVREMNPYFFGIGISDEPNYAIHSELEAFPWRGTALAVHMARIVSALCGALTVLATYRIGCLLWPAGGGPAAGAAAIVGLTPGMIKVNSYVTNDSLAVALTAWTIWAVLRLAREGISTRRALGAGILLGLSLLSKQTALFLIPVLALVLLNEARARRSLVPPLKAVAGIGLPVTVLTGWWYLRNVLLYDDPWGADIYFLHAGHADLPPLTLRWVAEQIVDLHERYWGRFGWGTISMHPAIYWVLAAAIVTALAAWAVALIRRESSSDRPAGYDLRVLVWLGILLVANGVWFMGFASQMGLVGLQSRYLYSTFPCAAALLAGGLWLPTRRMSGPPWLLIALCAFLGAVALAAPFLYILPTYSP